METDRDRGPEGREWALCVEGAWRDKVRRVTEFSARGEVRTLDGGNDPGLKGPAWGGG